MESLPMLRRPGRPAAVHQALAARQRARDYLTGRRRQRGVAVVTALLLTTLAVAIVASLFWQQQVQVRSMENQRLHLQTKWILLGALDFSRLVLQQDANFTSQTTLDGIWATPVAETRLDQYIERERVEGESFDATVSGHMIDAQSRYNLGNLSADRLIKPEQVGMLQRLLLHLQLDAGLAMRIAQAVAATQSPPLVAGTPMVGPQSKKSNATGPIEMMQVDDLLVVPGVTPEILAKLKEFVIFLPEVTKVNVNTAPAEVLASLSPDLSLTEANTLVARRKQAYFRDEGDFKGAAGSNKTWVDGMVEVKSSYFLVLSQVRLDRASLDSEALMNRKNESGGQTRIVWIRQN